MDIKVNQLQQLTQMEAPKNTQTNGEDFKFTLISNIKEDQLQEKLSSLMKEIEEQILARKDELMDKDKKKNSKNTAAAAIAEVVKAAANEDDEEMKILDSIDDEFDEFTPAD